MNKPEAPLPPPICPPSSAIFGEPSDLPPPPQPSRDATTGLLNAFRQLSVHVIPTQPSPVQSPIAMASSTPHRNRSSTATPARRSIFSQSSSATASPQDNSSAPSTASSPVACSICISPIREGRRGGRFQTQCCHQLFHKECLQKHKEHTASPSHPRACPLCRSVAPTGLTPYRPPILPSMGGGGFISGLALHAEMRRRVSAARNAVARSIAARTAATTAAAAASGGSRANVGTTPAVDAPQPSDSGTNIFFTSPGAAYTAVRARQFEARMRAEQSQRILSDGEQHGRGDGDAEGGAFAGLD